MTKDKQFERTDRAVMQAAIRIELAVAGLLAKTQRLDYIARAYVIERLMDELAERYPEALDYLNKLPGTSEGTMRLMNAVMDWRDNWADR
jgi:hypothetical protein